jgi:hypothetical protein
VTPPPWRQRMRGRVRSIGFGGVVVMVGLCASSGWSRTYRWWLVSLEEVV